jgi:hypothetical protein
MSRAEPGGGRHPCNFVAAKLPHSGIVCRAARDGTWRFAAQLAITCIVQRFTGIFQRQMIAFTCD